MGSEVNAVDEDVVSENTPDSTEGRLVGPQSIWIGRVDCIEIQGLYPFILEKVCEEDGAFAD